MTPTETELESRHESKARFLSAAVHVIRAKGYSATRIEDVCEAAGLTKGSFFYHFESKEGLALEAADYWRPVQTDHGSLRSPSTWAGELVQENVFREAI
jgi:AcrR family transcriptional regulator